MRVWRRDLSGEVAEMRAVAESAAAVYGRPTLTVEQVNALLGVDLWAVRSFRADVRIDFREDGSIIGAALLNPDHAPTREDG